MAIAEHGTQADVSQTPPSLSSVEPSRVFTINIRIYVYPQGGRWYAASTDYVLMAEGATEAEAVQRFIESSVAYLKTALERGWIDALNRRPSFLRRVEIRRRVVMARLLRQHPLKIRKSLELGPSSRLIHV